MRKNKKRVEKTRICVSIPTELLDECDLYIDNYSAYFTACLKNKLSSIQKKQMAQENSVDTMQIPRTFSSSKSAESSTLPQNMPDNEDNYEELLQIFLDERARKERA